MRSLAQPGPVHPNRIESFAGEARQLVYTVAPGVSLLAGLTGPLVAAGFQAATVRFTKADVDPFRYVMPAPASDTSHVAYFSSPRAPVGKTQIERASATFGFHLGRPFLHCHAAWIEPDGQRRGGHILNDETVLVSAVEVEAWGFDRLRLTIADDPETNFTLFHPSGDTAPGTGAILARVRPNEDVIRAIETIAQMHGMSNAVVQGSVGSLIGTRFEDGREVTDYATEVLITQGSVHGGVATLKVLTVDMSGSVHEGRLARGENPVCITFDLVLIQTDA